MAKRGFDPDDRPPVRFVDDPELAYVARRAREAHDLWHVLFGCPTTVLGELAIKAIEFAQVCQLYTAPKQPLPHYRHTAKSAALFIKERAVHGKKRPGPFQPLPLHPSTPTPSPSPIAHSRLLAAQCSPRPQTGMPMAALSVAGAQFRLTPDDRRLLWGVYAPWAMRTGLRCADLMCVYYERLFEEDIDSVRSRLRITKAPTRREAMAMAGMGVAQSESKG